MEACQLAVNRDAPRIAVEIDPELETRFTVFYREHRERARRIAWRLVGGDEAAASDVMQNAFLKAYGALPRYREQQQLEAWFHRILVRQAANHRRWRALRRHPRFEDTEVPTAAPDADPLLAARLQGALEALTAPQREAFVLVHLEGLTVAEAAAAMGKATGTVKSHLQRALVALRERLRDCIEEPHGP